MFNELLSTGFRALRENRFEEIDYLFFAPRSELFFNRREMRKRGRPNIWLTLLEHGSIEFVKVWVGW